QYICFIDADDKIDDSMMESYIEIVNLYKPDIITTNIYQYHVGNRQYIEVKNDLPYGQILREDDIVKFFIQPYYGGNLGIIPSPCNKLYRTDFIKNHTLQFDKSLKRAEDYWLNFYA